MLTIWILVKMSNASISLTASGQVCLVSVHALSPKHNADDYIEAVKFYNERWDVNLWFYQEKY